MREDFANVELTLLGILFDAAFDENGRRQMHDDILILIQGFNL